MYCKEENKEKTNKKRSKRITMKKLKKQVKGITLIALVVTIIVLLILAGIALNLTIGENGLFTRAQNAANTWKNAETNEQSAMNDLSSWMDQYLNGNGGEEDNQGPIKVSFKIEGEKVTTPPVPSGFSHVDGTEINSGYVIQDTNGNQFVWVPVDKNQKIKINVTSEAKIDSINLTDPYGDPIQLENTTDLGTTYNNENVEPNINGTYILTVTSGEETKTKELNVTSLYALRMWELDMLTEEIAQAMGYENLDQLMQDYFSLPAGSKVEDTKNMICQEYKQGRFSNTDENKESVNDNGGFYIARYEASYQAGKVASKASTSTRTSWLTTLTNGMLWNNISQTEALAKANEMYTSGDFTSSLPTGAAWDRTLSWLEETKQVSILELVGDSKTWGNYLDDEFSNTEELINTGNFSKTEKNHIFDLAGNLWEWTTESNSGGGRINRGGNYRSSGSYHPASNRYGYSPDSINEDLGFRVALYL